MGAITIDRDKAGAAHRGGGNPPAPTSGVRFYCGIGETRWNHHAVQPGAFACVSPVKGRTVRTLAVNRVHIPHGVKVMQDSGAFQDSWATRLTFDAALDRQIAHAAKYHYTDQIEYRVSYDLLIDEVWQDGQRTKRRWSVAQADEAIAVTIAAAKYLSNHRHDLPLVLSAQGVDASQYRQCVEAILPYIDTTQDMLGLGGWCIIGMRPAEMMPVFRQTIRDVIPLAARQGVRRVHIFGVIYPVALGELLWICDQHDIAVSTDSTSPANHPWRGQWGYGEWRDNNYQRVSVQERGLERARHVQLTREWLARLSCTKWYHAPETLRQLTLF